VKLRRLGAALFLAGFLLAACAHTDRPEGIVERWLTSLNQGSAGRPGHYAPDLLSQGVLPNWQACEPGALDVIEVGRGIQAIALATKPGPQYLVPYRVEYADDRAMRCHTTRQPDVTTHGVAVLGDIAPPGRTPVWRLAAALPVTAVRQHLPLPSEGGRPVARSSGLLWLLGLAIGAVLCAAVALVMRATPWPAPVSSEPLDPSEARGL
jgi:hypothetical protein